MPSILFVVHGMGRHPVDWAGQAVARLAGAAEAYGYSWLTEHGGLDRHVAVVPVRYDDIFDRYLGQWGSSAEALGARARELGVDLAGILGWLERADETERNVFWTHLVDVVLYRFFSIVTAEVRLRVREAIATTLEAAGRDGQLIGASVLAHSLGTAVAHDALALLGGQPIPTPHGPSEAWMAGSFTFANLFMCANVSRVLETEPKVYRSVVHPPTAGPGPSYVDAYYDFRHRFDPFPVVRPFAPVGWGARYVRVESGEQVLDFNVHTLEHYLEDPRVHVPILRALVGRWAVTDAEWEAARRTYDAKPQPPCARELLSFKATAARIIALAGTGADPTALVIAGAQFLAAAREAADACR
ncbi:MAG TPA: hypothetical protein VFS08_03225 [Gemmatimonadaceae bacterium]|nr:hypothetical protein [Gemmatimonadaceae bacterium]